MKLKELLAVFESYCPPSMAMKGDFCGLQIGRMDRDIQKVLFTLDVRPEVVQEAIDLGVDLIFAKHQPIFKPIQALTDQTAQSAMYLDLIQHDIAVYVAHTNIDIVPDGLNDWFCERLDLQVTDFLSLTHAFNEQKLVVYVPQSHAEQLRIALGAVGAGLQGNYQATSFTSSGIGRFTPNEWANPTIGANNQAEAVEEERIEFLVKNTLLPTVLATLKQVHPYEEPAYDIFDLAPFSASSQNYGIGRVGKLAQPETLADFCQRVKTAFGLEHLRIIFPPKQADWQQVVQTVAICGGSGEKFYREALQKGADVFITGDVYYHTAHDLQANQLITLDPGHHIEVLFVEKLLEKFTDWQKQYHWEVDFLASKVDTNPFMTI